MAKSKTFGKSKSLAKIRKKHGGGLAKDVSLETDKIPWLPCSSAAINHMLGGGIPYGRILELYGAYSSGKTLLAYDFLYVAQQLGGVGLWVDAENAWTENWADKNFIDSDRVELLTDISIENISDWLLEVGIFYRGELKNNEPIVAVIDSTAALDTDANLNTSQLDAKAEMGNRAKAIYRMIRLRNPMFVKLGITVIFINQMRDKVGATKWEDPNTTVGGRAMEFFASQRMAVIGGKKVTSSPNNKGLLIGKEVSIRMHKNKVAPPKSTFKTEMYFVETEKYSIGMNPTMGLYDMLMEEGTLFRKGGSLKVYLKGDDENHIAMGEKGFLKLLAEDENWLEDNTTLNTIERTKKLLDSLDENLYKVGEKSEYTDESEEEVNND